MNAAGLDVEIEDVTESVAALALQGPFSRAVLEAATGESTSRTCATSAAAAARIAAASRRRRLSRTGYTGDLGYELWIAAEDAPAVWDALFEAGPGVRDPAGGHARPRRHAARGRPDPARGRLHVAPATR